MKTKAKLGRLKIPAPAWGVFDPKGALRQLYTKKPGETAAAWIYVADLPDRPNGYVESPTDLIAAKKQGYRVKKLVVKPN